MAMFAINKVHDSAGDLPVEAQRAAAAAALDTPGTLLAIQLVNAAAGLAALYFVVLKRHRSELKELRLFRFTTKRPLQAPAGWLAWALMGALLSVGVMMAVGALLKAVGYYNAVGGGYRTARVLALLVRPDFGSFLCLALTVGVLAPLTEEIAFRGLMLASLTKWMPTWAAVLCSSVAFAAIHLSLCDLPSLAAFACVLGFAYVRSKSLLTPMLIHGAWNMLVLTVMYVYVCKGWDLAGLLAG
jgi:hypothetical protein